jgi:hypothetical protein
MALSWHRGAIYRAQLTRSRPRAAAADDHADMLRIEDRTGVEERKTALKTEPPSGVILVAQETHQAAQKSIALPAPADCYLLAPLYKSPLGRYNALYRTTPLRHRHPLFTPICAAVV